MYLHPKIEVKALTVGTTTTVEVWPPSYTIPPGQLRTIALALNRLADGVPREDT